MARAVTIPAATTKPWTNRPTVSNISVGAKAHSSDDTDHSASPTMTGSRRPTRSEMGPINSWPSARPRTHAVSVSWT